MGKLLILRGFLKSIIDEALKLEIQFNYETEMMHTDNEFLKKKQYLPT